MIRPAKRHLTSLLLLVTCTACGMTPSSAVDPEIRRSVDAILVDLSPAPADVGTRYRVAKQLSDCGPAGVPVLLELLGSTNGDVRATAIHALGLLQDNSQVAVDELINLLQDDDTTIRSNAAWTLSVLKPPHLADALPLLAESLRRDLQLQPLQEATARAFVAAGLPARAGLLVLLRDPEPTMRWISAFCLGRLSPGVEGTHQALVAALSDDEPKVRHWAGAALVHVAGLREEHVVLVPDLIRALSDQDPLVAEAVADTIGFFGPRAKEAVPALTLALTNPNQKVSAAAKHALELINAP